MFPIMFIVLHLLPLGFLLLHIIVIAPSPEKGLISIAIMFPHSVHRILLHILTLSCRKLGLVRFIHTFYHTNTEKIAPSKALFYLIIQFITKQHFFSTTPKQLFYFWHAHSLRLFCYARDICNFTVFPLICFDFRCAGFDKFIVST